MITFKKSLLGLTVAAVLSGCGGSSDSPSASQPTSTAVSGLAIKGVLNNAIVTAYKYVDGAAVELASAVTDDQGRYTLNIADYSGPVKIEISPSTDPSNPTQMLCDAVDGCGEVDFGQSLNLTVSDPSFKLNAIAVVDPTASTAQKINISAVTHLAAAIIEDGTVTNANIAKTLSEVANSLQIIGDINELEPTNVNDIAAVAGEDNPNELNYGLVNAAIAAQLFSGESDAAGVISSKLTAAAEDLIANGGEFLGANDNDTSNFELNVVDILTNIQSLVTELATVLAADTTIDNTLAAVLSENFDSIKTTLTHSITETEASLNEDGRVDAVSDTTTSGGAIAIASGLVNDLRLLANLFDVTKVSGADVNTNVVAYNELTNAAALMLETENESFTLLSDISAAVAQIELMQETDSTTVQYDLAKLVATGSTATGSITYDTENFTFIVNATDGDKTATLNATAAIGSDNKSVNVTFNGAIESPGAVLTLADTSSLTINFAQTVTTDMLEDDDSDIMPVSGKFMLDATLSQKATSTVTDPMSFSGKISADLVTVITPELWQDYWNWDGNAGQIHIELEPLLLPEFFSLSGELTSKDTSASVIFTVAAPDAATYEAAGLANVGRKIDQNYSVSVSADGNTITENMTNGFTSELVYKAGANAGEFEFSYDKTALDAASSDFGATFNSTHYVSQVLKTPGTEYFFAGTYQDNDDIGGYNTTITPDIINGVIAGYQVLHQVVTYDIEQIQRAAVLDPQTHVIVSGLGGWTNTQEYYFDSLEDYLQSGLARYNLTPDQLTSALKIYQSIMATTGGSRNNVKDVGEVVALTTDAIASLANGGSLTLDSYVTKPLFNDAIKLDITENGNNVSTYVTEQLVSQWLYTSTASTAGNFVLTKTTGNYWNDITLTSSTAEVSGTADLQLTLTHQIGDYSETKVFSPNELGSYQICQSSQYLNDGTVTDSPQESCFEIGATTLENAVVDTYISGVIINPLTINSALAMFQADVVTNDYDYNSLGGWIDDIGNLEHELTDSEYTAIASLSTTENTTIIYDAELTRADELSGLESETHYLAANAKLTLKAVLGDYDVTLSVAVNRTGYEDATFDLTATYKLPNESTQRTFTVSVDSTNEEQVIVTNAEGASITLVKAADTDPEALLGTIKVDGTQVAEVVDRDGIVLIIYTNGVVESI